MNRIRPQSYKIIAKKKTLSYRLTQKNEKYIQSHENKGNFYRFFKGSKTSIIIHYTIVVYLTHFLHFTKYTYIIFVMKRLHYLHERRQERKKCVFAKLLADMTLRAQKKCLRWHFSNPQNGKTKM